MDTITGKLGEGGRTVLYPFLRGKSNSLSRGAGAGQPSGWQSSDQHERAADKHERASTGAAREEILWN
jgi:hypothetical protein